MKTPLPSSVENYFAAKNARDFDKGISGFSLFAVVRDEDHIRISSLEAAP